jgi:hypothetical protein
MMSLTWFFRKTRQVEEGGFRWRTMYVSTVDLATSMPIFLSSPTIQGAPQSGFPVDICRIRSRTSRGTVGRPGSPHLLSLVQCSRNLRRRHAMTVSGWTKTSTVAPPEPMAGEPRPQDSIGRSNRRTSGGPLVDGKLVPEREDLDLHGESGPEEIPKELDEGGQRCQHSRRLQRPLGGCPE